MLKPTAVFRVPLILMPLVCLLLTEAPVTEAATPKVTSSKATAPTASEAVPGASPQVTEATTTQVMAETYNPHAHKEGAAAMLILGTQLQGVGVRYYLTPTLAIQGQVGRVPLTDGVLFGLDALVERPLLVELPQVVVSWHAGLGAAVGSATVTDQAVSLGFYAAVAGVSADAKQKPVSVSLDVRAGLMQAGLADLDPVNRFGMSAELGVLYFFK